MAKRKRISANGPKSSSSRLQAIEPQDTNKLVPVFSFERLQSGSFCFSTMTSEQQAAFGEMMYRRKDLTWSQLIGSQRHGLGTEKIPKKQIKATIPNFITDDMDYFLVFRFFHNAPLVGYRVGQIFYVLWFDPNFDLYPH